jgi:hypothetical protein
MSGTLHYLLNDDRPEAVINPEQSSLHATAPPDIRDRRAHTEVILRARSFVIAVHQTVLLCQTKSIASINVHR